jgi:energy-coupling factor transporter transmembrane protein EcfT
MKQFALTLTLSGIIAGIISLSGNVVSGIIAESWKKYLWISWPVFLAATTAGILIGMWQFFLQNKITTINDASEQSKENRPTAFRKKGRVYRVFGLPIWEVTEYEEERRFWVFGMPIISLSKSAIILSPNVILSVAIGIIAGGLLLSPKGSRITSIEPKQPLYTTTIEAFDPYKKSDKRIEVYKTVESSNQCC